MFKQFLKHTPFGISLLVLFTAAAFLLLTLPIFGNKTLIVRTGSMAPKIAVGDLIFVWPKQNYRVGDIIAFSEGGRRQTTITHRIVAIKESPFQGDSLNTQSSQVLYQTKGDANKQADGALVPKSSVLGSADYSIKGIGKIFAMVKTKNGFLLTAIFPAALVIILELVNIANALKKPKAYAVLPVTPNPLKGVSLKRRLLFNYTKIPNPPKTFHTPMGLNVPSASIQSFVALILEKINIRSLKPSAGVPYYATSFKALLPYAIVVVIFTGTAFATTYSDSEESAGNIFRAASSYPSPTPTPSPSVSPSPSPSPTPSPAPCTSTGSSVVVNEINWTGANGDGNDEWVELCNTTGSPIDLTNWVIEDLGTGGPNADITIPSGTIPANGFFLISSNNQANSAINVASDFVDTGISLTDGGEQLILKNNGGTTIDTANGTGAWFAGLNSTPKKSMERKNPAGDGTISTNWQTATTHTNMDGSGATDEFGTPKAANGL